MLEGANNPLTRAKGSLLPEIAAVMSYACLEGAISPYPTVTEFSNPTVTR